LQRRRVIVVNTSNNSTQAFDLPRNLSDFEVQILLAPAGVGQPPRYVRLDRRAQLRSVSEDDAPSGGTSYLSAIPFAKSRLLNGGRYLLSGVPQGEMILADLSNGKSLDLADFGAVVPLDSTDGWRRYRAPSPARASIRPLVRCPRRSRFTPASHWCRARTCRS
jgi:hypothetical protein